MPSAPDPPRPPEAAGLVAEGATPLPLPLDCSTPVLNLKQLEKPPVSQSLLQGAIGASSATVGLHPWRGGQDPPQTEGGAMGVASLQIALDF